MNARDTLATMHAMDDITHKTTTLRRATAQARLTMSPTMLHEVRDDPACLETARVAASQGSLKTSMLVPYCHPVPVECCAVAFGFEHDAMTIDVSVKAIGKVGVEMEALTAASAAALSVFRRAYACDASVAIAGIHLTAVKGRDQDYVERFQTPPRAGVVVMSDSVSTGKKSDKSGRLIVERLEAAGLVVEQYGVVADDTETIVQTLLELCDERKLDLVLTTGGTGLGPRDHTPEAMARVVEREAPGIAEAARAYGQWRTPYAMLSRGRAGLRGNTLIVNLPGSSRGVQESLDALLPGLFHAFGMMRGGGH